MRPIWVSGGLFGSSGWSPAVPCAAIVHRGNAETVTLPPKPRVGDQIPDGGASEGRQRTQGATLVSNLFGLRRIVRSARCLDSPGHDAARGSCAGKRTGSLGVVFSDPLAPALTQLCAN